MTSRLQIYPYWNVNTDFEFTQAVEDILQIYPYWNVNEGNCSGFICKIFDFKSIHTGM